MKHLFVGLFALLVVCIQVKANPTETDLSSVDRLALNVPSFASESMESLVAFGQANTKNDLEKARFFFIWIAQNIKYDSVEYASKKRITDKQKPDTVFTTHRALCRGYADLLTLMCQKAGLSARTVTGYCRNTEGGTVDSLEFHAWNILKIKDKWHLFDVTWASNELDKSISIDTRLEQYFLQQPTSFIKRHLPFDPVCQLSDSIVSRNAFFFDTTDSVLLEKSYFGNGDSILNQELHLDWIELNIRSYDRALTFMPEEKRLYDVLSYFKSEKAHLYFNQAMKLLDVFNNLDEKTLTNWSYNDLSNKIEEASTAQTFLNNALNLYESMTFIVENEDAGLKKRNMLIISKNIEATNNLIAFLQSIEKEMRRIPIARK
jgi:hypothetical protein